MVICTFENVAGKVCSIFMLRLKNIDTLTAKNNDHVE